MDENMMNANCPEENGAEAGSNAFATDEMTEIVGNREETEMDNDITIASKIEGGANEGIAYEANTASDSRQQYEQSFNTENRQFTEQPVNEQYNRYQGSSNSYNAQSNAQPSGNYTGYNQDSIPVSYLDRPIKKQRPKKEKKPMHFALKAVIAALIFGVVGAGTFIGVNKLINYVDKESKTPETVSVTVDKQGIDMTLNPVVDSEGDVATTQVIENVNMTATDVSAIVEKAMPSVVIIDSTFTSSSFFGTYESAGGGSGIIIDRTDSEILIATNNHVVEKAKDVKVTFIDGKTHEALVKGTDPDADLAVIAVKVKELEPETLSKISVAELGDSDSVKVGQMAIAIGNALGYGQSTTVGYISAKEREVTVESGKTLVLLQTDAAINPGNSGGALLNINGEVIGINSVKYASSTVEGMGFAIPISKAVSILNELKIREILSDEEKGFLGVSIGTVTDEIAKEYNWPKGVYVSEVTAGYAADLAGIKVGDIIVAVNDKETLTNEELKSYVNAQRVGTTVKVTVKRLENGVFVDKSFDVTLTMDPSLDKKEEDTQKDTTEDDLKEAEEPDENTEEDVPDGDMVIPFDENEDDSGENYYYGDGLDGLPDEIKDFLEDWGFFGP